MTESTLTLEESLPTTGSNGEPDGRFRYGWRYVCRLSNGVEEWERVPLTEDDVLHPQLEDYVSQSHIHHCICHYLYTVLRSRLKRIPGGLVLHDVLIDWGVPGLKGHAPDLAVFAEVWEPPQEGSFDLKQSGGRVLLVMEVTSPSTRHLDVASKRPGARTKFRHYAQAKIPLYIVVDAARRVGGQAPPIFGYALTEDGYQPLPLNEAGRLWVEPVGLWLGPSGSEVVWFDEDGTEIWEYEQEQETRLEAEARLREEQAARLAAEARAWEEQKAHLAEQVARLMAEARAQEEQA
ncbi:MAG: Uma2 family endonuclease, partial [Chloroflexaceae bacterium]|nr:Uma2 family endonuclease [Chloroflexaceae bacterium]